MASIADEMRKRSLQIRSGCIDLANGNTFSASSKYSIMSIKNNLLWPNLDVNPKQFTMNDTNTLLVIILATLIIIGLARMIWTITVKLSKIGAVGIPIASALLATYTLKLGYEGDLFRGAMGEVFGILFYVLIIILGTMGTLTCYLHAELDRHDTTLKEVLRKTQHQKASIPKESTSQNV